MKVAVAQAPAPLGEGVTFGLHDASTMASAASARFRR
jgi:hypothetical protein